MFDVLAAVFCNDPAPLAAWAILLMSLAMYPLGFFMTCSPCCEVCSNTSCNGFDIDEVYSRRTAGRQICSITIASGGTTFTTYDEKIQAGCRVTGTNIAANTFITDKSRTFNGVEFVYTYTFSPATTGAINSGCITVCGRSGLCSTGQEITDAGCGALGPGASGSDECNNDPPDDITGCSGAGFRGWHRRRSCIRWVCRCYSSTGQRGQTTDVSLWYEVVSTTVVGGPTTNDLDLGDALQTEPCDGRTVETWYIRNSSFGDFTFQPAGTIACIVWAFTFYGWVADCETPYTSIATPHEPRDDCFTISACKRCD